MVARTLKDLRIRKNFAKVPKIIDIPDLISIQKNSYEKFLQKDVSEKRENVGSRRSSRASSRSATSTRPQSSSSSATTWRRRSTTSTSAAAAA
jgi:DNA-directed RNA polymerase beta subunit